MTIAESPKRSLDWVCVQRMFSFALAFGFAFALGGWVVSIRDQAARLPYFERATKSAEQVQAVAGQNPVAVINCLKRKSAVANSVAEQAVKAAVDERAKIPNLSQIPNCPPQKPPLASAPK